MIGCGPCCWNNLVLTDDNADPIETDGLTIEIRSVARWLLEGRAGGG